MPIIQRKDSRNYFTHFIIFFSNFPLAIPAGESDFDLRCPIVRAIIGHRCPAARAIFGIRCPALRAICESEIWS